MFQVHLDAWRGDNQLTDPAMLSPPFLQGKFWCLFSWESGSQLDPYIGWSGLQHLPVKTWLWYSPVMGQVMKPTIPSWLHEHKQVLPIRAHHTFLHCTSIPFQVKYSSTSLASAKALTKSYFCCDINMLCYPHWCLEIQPVWLKDWIYSHVTFYWNSHM